MNAEQSIRNLQRQIDDLKLAQRNCPHKWSDPVADHIYIEGYTDPGDPVGTMGIDWRGP